MPGGGQDNSRLAAPIVRKKKKRTTTYQPPSVIPGVKHTIEGMPSISKTISPLRGNQAQPSTRRGISKKDIYEESGSVNTGANVAAQEENKRQSRQYDSAVKRFQAVQAARKRIKPIADPEAGTADRRRTAARRRMRGRLGTLLSQRETLG